ncbi:UNVERIFIED_CONTAM: hypothetical protein FKN15_026559 [Acipenser sinensis]
MVFISLLSPSQFILKNYGEDPENYNEQLKKLEQLRQGAVNVTRDFEGCSTLRKYFGQLHYLQSRVPMGSGQEAAVPITWTEIFSGKMVTHDDISYEQACILYNLVSIRIVGLESDSSRIFRDSDSSHGRKRLRLDLETDFTVLLIFSFPPSPSLVSPPKKRRRKSHQSHRLERSEQLDKLWEAVSQQGNMLVELLCDRTATPAPSAPLQSRSSTPRMEDLLSIAASEKAVDQEFPSEEGDSDGATPVADVSLSAELLLLIERATDVLNVPWLVDDMRKR